MTPLQQAAQAVINQCEAEALWATYPWVGAKLTELRKALDAELAQSVEPVAWMTQDGVACIPLYLHPPQPTTVKQYLKVGDSRFESWYSELNQAGKGSKQIAREAYEAGLNEADAQPKSLIRERAQLEQEWCELRGLKQALEENRHDAERLDWLERNLFNRENLDMRGNVCNTHLMWVMFAPRGVQGSARTIIDAAMAEETK